MSGLSITCLRVSFTCMALPAQSTPDTDMGDIRTRRPSSQPPAAITMCRMTQRTSSKYTSRIGPIAPSSASTCSRFNSLTSSNMSHLRSGRPCAVDAEDVPARRRSPSGDSDNPRKDPSTGALHRRCRIAPSGRGLAARTASLRGPSRYPDSESPAHGPHWPHPTKRAEACAGRAMNPIRPATGRHPLESSDERRHLQHATPLHAGHASTRGYTRLKEAA